MTCFTLRLTGDGLPAGAREVPLSELVSTFLRASAPRAYCDACLAVAVREPVEVVHRTVRGLTELAQFTRKTGRCRTCRSTKRIVTRAAPATLARDGPVGLAPAPLR
ncbi:hypothetical protein [Methylorubrum extorquens]